MVELADFGTEEISQMQRYIETNVHNTFLQQVYVLTENPEEKALAFVTAFRILNSCMNYATDGDLREKMMKLLNECKDVYAEIFSFTLKLNNHKIDFGKSRALKKIVNILDNPSKSMKVNKLIDAFLVFGEKIELINIDSVTGVDLENDHGKEAMKDIQKIVDSEKI